MVRTLQVSLPLLLILSLTREPWAQFGIVRFSWLLDVTTGVAIWMCGWVAYLMIVCSLPQSVLTETAAGRPIAWARPEGVLGALLVLAASVANGFAEELVMRGYLLTRLERLLHSTGLAILASTALFASYHVYQGAIGLAGATAAGLVYGSAYCLQRRLWPVCIAHAITSFIGVMSA